MGDVVVNLLPLVVAAVVVPLYTVAVLLLLQSENGLLKASAFVTGGVAVRLAQGILFGLVIGTACKANPEPGPRFIVSTLLILGILLLVAAWKQWQKQADPDAPTPQWMNALAGLTPLKAVGAGALFPIIAIKQWVFTLSAIGVIGEYGPGGMADAAAYVVFVLATQTGVLIPILAFALSPARAAKPLQAAQAWLERNNRAIVMVMSLVLGAWFLFKGVAGLR